MTRNAKKTTVTTDRILSSLQIHVVTGSCRTSQKKRPLATDATVVATPAVH